MIERIFIDASYTLASGKNSGIERVVRSILRENTVMGQAGEIPIPQPVVSLEEQFFAAGTEQVAAIGKPAAMYADVLARMPRTYHILARSICAATGSRRLRKWLLPQAGHLGLFKLPHAIYEATIRRQIARKCPPLEFRSGDLLLLPDAYWVKRLRGSVWPAACRARQQGACIATVLYDLIPLTHPEFVGLKRRDSFLDYLKKLANHSDLIMAISATVRDQVSAYLPSIAGPEDNFCRHIESFELGAELSSFQGEVRPAIRQLFAGESTPYLTVATFDPRKNHKYLLDAFELLWQRNDSLQLCLVGRFGSRCDDIFQRVTKHPRLGKQLHVFSDLSDVELQHCYEGARGVVLPSIVEGFGLPIVESLWFGRKTFVSDTPIHREVGQGDCSYFDLASERSLADAITAWESVLAVDPSPVLPTRRPTAWRESARQVIQLCQAAVGSSSLSRATRTTRRQAA